MEQRNHLNDFVFIVLAPAVNNSIVRHSSAQRPRHSLHYFYTFQAVWEAIVLSQMEPFHTVPCSFEIFFSPFFFFSFFFVLCFMIHSSHIGHVGQTFQYINAITDAEIVHFLPWLAYGGSPWTNSCSADAIQTDTAHPESQAHFLRRLVLCPPSLFLGTRLCTLTNAHKL